MVRYIQDKRTEQAIFPQRIRTVIKNGKREDVPVALLPGYVFIYSDGEIVRGELTRIPDVLRVLSYGEDKYALAGRDLEFASWIYRLGGQIGVMKAAEVGDRIEVIDGAFKQLQGTIVKMDKRRRTIKVAINTDGRVWQMWLAYDIVMRVDDKLDPKLEVKE